MGFFSRKSTTTKTNEFAAVADSGNCSISNDTIGDVRSSPSYTPPPEGGGEIGAQTQPSISSQPPQPVGYKMDPAGDGSEYVDADLVTPETTTATTTGGESVPADDKEGQDATIPTNLDAADATDDDKEAALPQKVPFDGIKGVVQAPKYKDLKYFIFFVLHFGITIWWFVDSFIPNYTYYNYVKYSSLSVKHVPLIGVMITLNFMGLFISLFAVGYFLRHGQTVLKSTIFFSMSMCLGVGVFGLFIGEFFMLVAGLAAFAIVSIYANMVWKRIPFTAINLSVAIRSVRENMGLILAALQVCGIGFLWVLIAAIACVNAYKTYGPWTLLYFIFSFYWIQQVLSNVVSVATAGKIGRWFVLGESTPDLNTGLQDTLTRARTYSFGSICVESLFFGLHQMIHGLCTFLSSLHIPILPMLLNGITWCISKITNINEWTFVYIGLYGYSYTSAERNITTLFRNNGMDVMLRNKYAGNILFMSNMTIGLLTGVNGMMFAAFGYKLWRKAGMPNPALDGFIVGFLVGFLYSSIILSVITATMRTLIVCFAESPAEFKATHPELGRRMEEAWEIYDSEDRSNNEPKNESKGKAGKLSVTNLLSDRSKGSFLDTLKGNEMTTQSIV